MSISKSIVSYKGRNDVYATLQNQRAVTVYLKSMHFLSFGLQCRMALSRYSLNFLHVYYIKIRTNTMHEVYFNKKHCFTKIQIC